MSKLFVVAKKNQTPEDGEGDTEVRSEWAIFADTPEQAVACYLNPLANPLPEGDVPDEWYDTDCPIPWIEVGGLLVFGPYGEAR